MPAHITLEEVVKLLKNRGFIFPSSEIYGGLSAAYDYGPLGIQLRRNIERSWWKHFVENRPDVYGLDTAIFMNPKVWQASGHTEHFTDPLIECKSCHFRFRPDKLVDEALRKEGKKVGSISPTDHKGLAQALDDYQINCPQCGKHDFTDIRDFNSLFETHQGVVEESESTIYLRGEIAQGMFVNFKNIEQSMRAKLPFGIAQQGKAFRNEVTVKRFIFRTREFNLMEIEYFTWPKQADKDFTTWKEAIFHWYTKEIGIDAKHLTWREQTPSERAHYSAGTFDLEYAFPWGDDEIGAIANRTDFDLKNHQKHSGVDMTVADPATQEKIIPYCIEPTFGIDRVFLAVIMDALEIVEGGRAGTEISKHSQELVLHLAPALAPVQIAILPLSKKDELVGPARELQAQLGAAYRTELDITQSIGKRYRRQDEIGTPFCITIDFETAKDKKVTVRDRDTMKQDRIEIAQLEGYFQKKIKP